MSECVADEHSDISRTCINHFNDEIWNTVLADFSKTVEKYLQADLLIVTLLDSVSRRAYLNISGNSIDSPLQKIFTAATSQWSPEFTAALLTNPGSIDTDNCEANLLAHNEKYSLGFQYRLVDPNSKLEQNTLMLLSELGTLLLDQTVKNIELQSQFEQSKLESLAEFAAGAGHEINNPVATISGRVQLLLQQETNPARRNALATIGGQALRIRDMIGDLMLYGRPPSGQQESVRLLSALELVIEKLNLQEKCQLIVNMDGPLEIEADPNQLAIVLSEILNNCLNAAENKLVVRISAEEQSFESIRGVLIRIEDNAAGLSRQEREHLFDPFYSGRQAGRGLGFGLPKCWRIVKNHHGSIQALPNKDKGLTLEIWWPAVKPAAD